jgi:hypothetical protein
MRNDGQNYCGMLEIVFFSKVKRRQKFVWGHPKEFAGSTLNPKKYIGTPNLPIKTKIFSKKVCLVIQNIKSTNQDEIFSKKSMFSTLKKKICQKFV